MGYGIRLVGLFSCPSGISLVGLFSCPSALYSAGSWDTWHQINESKGILVSHWRQLVPCMCSHDVISLQGWSFSLYKLGVRSPPQHAGDYYIPTKTVQVYEIPKCHVPRGCVLWSTWNSVSHSSGGIDGCKLGGSGKREFLAIQIHKI